MVCSKCKCRFSVPVGKYKVDETVYCPNEGCNYFSVYQDFKIDFNLFDGKSPVSKSSTYLVLCCPGCGHRFQKDVVNCLPEDRVTCPSCSCYFSYKNFKKYPVIKMDPKLEGIWEGDPNRLESSDQIIEALKNFEDRLKMKQDADRIKKDKEKFIKLRDKYVGSTKDEEVVKKETTTNQQEEFDKDNDAKVVGQVREDLYGSRMVEAEKQKKEFGGIYDGRVVGKVRMAKIKDIGLKDTDNII